MNQIQKHLFGGVKHQRNKCYHASQELGNVFEHKCQNLFINRFSNSNNKSLHDIHFF